MTFPYLRITPQIKQPIISIFLKSKNKFVIYPTLIDSGSDYCIFSIELAEVLGIKLFKDKAQFRGIGKDKVKGYWGEIDVRVDDVQFIVKAIFAEIGEFGHGILGQKGFFDIFVVKFDLVKEEIELKQR